MTTFIHKYVYSLVALSSMFVGAAAWAQCDEPEIVQVLPSDGGPSQNFGSAVAVSGDRAIVGAMYDSGNGTSAGAAYAYQLVNGNWVEVQKLLASDGQSGDNFGYSSSVSGTMAVIGAWQDDDNGSNAGAAYVFKHDGNGWVQLQKLRASDGAAGDKFGISVGIDGDTIVVGAWSDDDYGLASGAAYVFEYDGGEWIETQKLAAPDAGQYDYFGISVGISGDAIVVGAYQDLNEGGAPTHGTAYVFRQTGSTWQFEQKLQTASYTWGDTFGSAVAIDGDVIIVGAPGSDLLATNAGACFVFRLNGTEWLEEAQLVASDGAQNDAFGCSVSVSGSVAIGGAYRDDVSAGSAYLFAHGANGWAESAKLIAPDAEANHKFGLAVDVAGQHAIAGALQNDSLGPGAGAVYFVSPVGGVAGTADCNGNGADDACDIALGVSLDVNGNGIPDECEAPSCAADIVSGATFEPPGDGSVDGADLAFLLGAWGPNEGSPADLVDSDTFAPPADGMVNGADLAAMLAAWGSCQ